MLLNITAIQIFCSQLGFVSWLQNHLLPCPFKYFTGIDCPGCGFQRSVVALIQGDFYKSVALYPAAIPLILLPLYLVADKYLKLDKPNGVLKKTLFMCVGGLILVSYCFKMWHIYHFYKVSV